MAKDVVSQPQKNVEKSIGAPAQTAEAMANDSQPTAGQGKTSFSQIEGQTKSLVAAGTLPGLTLEDSDTKANATATPDGANIKAGAAAGAKTDASGTKTDSTTGTKADASGTKTDATTGTKTDASGTKTDATTGTKAHATGSKTDATTGTKADATAAPQATTPVDNGPLSQDQVAAEAKVLEPMVKQFMSSADPATQQQALNSYQAEVAKVVSHGAASARQVFSSLGKDLSNDPQINAYVNPNFYTDGTPSIDVANKTLNANRQETELYTAVTKSSIMTGGSDGSAYTFNRTTAVVNGKPGATTATDKGTKASSSSNATGSGGYDSSAPASAQSSPYVQLSNGQIGYDNGITTSWTDENGTHTGIDGQQ